MVKNKHVIHVVESTATGTLTMLSKLANEQIKLGFYVSVIYSIRPETPKSIETYFSSGINLINIQMRSLKDKLASFILIRGAILSTKADVIYLHSSFAGFIGRLASLGLKGKVYYLPHCISLMRKDVGIFKKMIFAALEWAACVKKSSFVACSASEKSVIQKWVPVRKCILVENAVDVERWRSNLQWKERENIVITVGQIRKQKDPERFSDICRLVSQRGGGLKFIWVGDGDDALLKKRLLDSGVDVLGWKSPSEVQKLLENSQYYMSTALWEGMPVSPIEGMLSGCIGILSDCAGNRDILVNNQTGYIFSSVEQAVELLISLGKDKNRCEMMSKSGQEYCMTHYSLDRYFSEMCRLAI